MDSAIILRQSIASINKKDYPFQLPVDEIRLYGKNERTLIFRVDLKRPIHQGSGGIGDKTIFVSFFRTNLEFPWLVQLYPENHQNRFGCYFSHLGNDIPECLDNILDNYYRNLAFFDAYCIALNLRTYYGFQFKMDNGFYIEDKVFLDHDLNLVHRGKVYPFDEKTFYSNLFKFLKPSLFQRIFK